MSMCYHVHLACLLVGWLISCSYFGFETGSLSHPTLISQFWDSLALTNPFSSSPASAIHTLGLLVLVMRQKQEDHCKFNTRVVYIERVVGQLCAYGSLQTNQWYIVRHSLPYFSVSKTKGVGGLHIELDVVCLPICNTLGSVLRNRTTKLYHCVPHSGVAELNVSFHSYSSLSL